VVTLQGVRPTDTAPSAGALVEVPEEMAVVELVQGLRKGWLVLPTDSRPSKDDLVVPRGGGTWHPPMVARLVQRPHTKTAERRRPH
jgi:hypothetical protein